MFWVNIVLAVRMCGWYWRFCENESILLSFHFSPPARWVIIMRILLANYLSISSVELMDDPFMIIARPVYHRHFVAHSGGLQFKGIFQNILSYNNQYHHTSDFLCVWHVIFLWRLDTYLCSRDYWKLLKTTVSLLLCLGMKWPMVCSATQ
jgi:hypothetical protein